MFRGGSRLRRIDHVGRTNAQHDCKCNESYHPSHIDLLVGCCEHLSPYLYKIKKPSTAGNSNNPARDSFVLNKKKRLFLAEAPASSSQEKTPLSFN